MDMSNDYPTFDLQSSYLSYQERRWLIKQRDIYKLDKLIQSVIDLHKYIRGHEQFDLMSKSLTSSTLLPKVSLDNQRSLYYPSVLNGSTDNDIDQFRLHYQQMFQLIFNDLSTDINYRIFIILIEGWIFYGSQTMNEYTTSFTHEMRKCLSSFVDYIKSRTTKIRNILTLISKSSLSSYTIVHKNDQNNIGILFQLLPKIQYNRNSTAESRLIIHMDEYSKHIISPEELRYIDYSLNMKTKRHLGHIQQVNNNVKQVHASTSHPGFVRSGPSAGLSYQILHSLPIIYPYDDTMVYGQKYPLFWTGTNHKMDDSDKLFENISIEINTPEYLFVQRLFNKTISETDIKISFIERIQNPHLWEKFCSHRSYMKRKNGSDHLNENWLFHGTQSENHHQIMSHGFNRSYCRDYVLYGRGVYFSRYASYSCHYSDQKDLSFLFLCRVLVGHHTQGSNDIRIPPKLNLTNGKTVQADSTTDSHNPYDIVCTFHDDQNYPEYIITYMHKNE